MDTVELNTMNEFKELLNVLVKKYEMLSLAREIRKWKICHNTDNDFVRILQEGIKDYIECDAQMNLLCSIIYMIANKIDNLFIIDDTDKIYQINETESFVYIVKIVVIIKIGIIFICINSYITCCCNFLISFSIFFF